MGVMNCCIMLSPKYSLNLCTCLIWFEFELKILEKIKRKAIRNSEKKRKTHLSPSRRSQAQRGRARPRRLTGGAPPVSGDFVPPPLVLSLPLHLPLPSGAGVSASVALTRGPVSSVRRAVSPARLL
jgi:hypothetical protein